MTHRAAMTREAGLRRPKDRSPGSWLPITTTAGVMVLPGAAVSAFGLRGARPTGGRRNEPGPRTA
ncbi:hypothetical protein GCM10010246_00780 [Streptomyces cuspidosporus]|uniref:Uncharacterized protein n=1 Tax=Streptomyces cuspidosporus TaxID=66882 RepID=A0ABN3F9T3_9ACTN